MDQTIGGQFDTGPGPTWCILKLYQKLCLWLEKTNKRYEAKGAPKKAAKASGSDGSCQILPQTNFATANFIHTKNPWRDNFFHFPDKSEMFLQSILCA